MKTDDPHLGAHDVEWQAGVDKATITKQLLALLDNLIELLDDSGEEFASGAVAQTREEMALLRHFNSRLPHPYGSNGLLQVFCRLNWLDNDFDRFGDEEVNKVIWEIVNVSRSSIIVGDKPTA